MLPYRLVQCGIHCVHYKDVNLNNQKDHNPFLCSIFRQNKLVGYKLNNKKWSLEWHPAIGLPLTL